ncbi:MAG: TM0106 family RecB-like putative nuclease [Motiliproteus sp.]|nr:TM0106 family RecB-like putative nuclease [Motiliproteus sp.]MCW9053516.1 TM0106 family RecB-like putative nuclease [Motiliproteus sp.]
MYKRNGQMYFSPSDLTRYMDSPFASWMDRYAIECSDQAPEKDAPDLLKGVLAQKGYEHEDNLEAQFKEQGLSVAKIEGSEESDKRELTLAAMDSGADIIVQGRLELADFGGYSDFLVRVEGASRLGSYHYEIWDTKLASTVKPAFLVQLCCYAEMLEAIQGRKPANLVVALGNGGQANFKTHDYYFYYRSLKDAFLQSQRAFDPANMPDPADSNSWADWSDYAKQLLLERDHLFQVATITKGQIKKLNRAGLSTMHALAHSELEFVSGINAPTFARLKAQASIQLQTKERQDVDNSAPPSFEILRSAVGEKAGLALLPPHSSLDVFFDIEGFPLIEGGLEYLWGATYFTEQGDRAFKDYWAHDHEQEKQAFQSFIEWVYGRWLADPSMHIYHYANYEIAACRKLMGRYGVCEFEVDQLLRNGVFIDLYKIVKGGLLLGEPKYSIKNVEHLYRGGRETEVGSGGDSVVVYEQWRTLHQSGEQGDSWQTSSILNDIREYNIDDCDSTQELVGWLREQQAEHDISYIGQSEVLEVEVSEEVTERTLLRDRLLASASAQDQENPSRAALTENLAWTLEFHRREAKPVFWRMFERLGLSDVELIDDLDCLACCERTQREPFLPKPRARNHAYEYQFDPAQEFKGASSQFYLLGVETDDGKTAKVTYVKAESQLENGQIVLQAKEPPPSTLSLVPDEYVHPSPIPEAIEQFVRDYEQGDVKVGHSAILDFLLRSKPRFQAGFTFPTDTGEIAPSQDSTERLQQVIDAVCHLDSSYLAIQGPPGAGKSYTGKHVIAKLLKSGAKVGIASNSHKAINNLLLSTAQYCAEKNIQGRFACTKNTDPELEQLDISLLKNNVLAEQVEPACVLGTTAWGFSREDMAGQLDYLFVDEAGQVSVANLIAMSRSAKNLVLMGDQMQLGQPSQGTHPAESGLSVLDYLLHEMPTIPQDMGVFLGTTYRMHSHVNRFISDHIYEGKLESDPTTDKRIIEVPEEAQIGLSSGTLNKEAGILFVPVEHEGNTQASDEEVEQIKALSGQLLGRIFHTGDPSEPTRPIGWNDMLFVAPYNHQVAKLKQALGEQAKVGSVDKFQGQEAPIVFLSMCASDPAESPRGLDFLFDKHRINVAISRAQSLAIIVANPAIGRVITSNTEQLKLVNLFNAITMQSLDTTIP